jgi:hypothetical protein
MLYSKLNDESGMVMFVVMIVTLLSSILMTSYMSFVVQESKHSVWQKEKSQALFLAESGIQKGLYFLNEPDDPSNPWAPYIDYENNVLLVDESMIPEYIGTDVDDGTDQYDEYYTISLHNRFVDENGLIIMLPPRYFLIKSTGTIKKTIPISHSISAIVCKMRAVIDGPAALCIYDDVDPEDELLQFDSSQWNVSGVNYDDPTTGVAGVAIANTGDNLNGQLGTRLNNVEGMDGNGTHVVGDLAIVRDESLPKDLSELIEYFRPMSTDITGIGNLSGDYLGAPDNYLVQRADLSQGDIQILGGRTGYGVLILEGDGTFAINGNAEWFGLILVSGKSNVHLRGGGATAAHIYGCLMIDDGTATMNGTSDVRYSSAALANLDKQHVVYQVYSWCGEWGMPLGRFDEVSDTPIGW